MKIDVPNMVMKALSGFKYGKGEDTGRVRNY